jgi:serine/threonine-protein kinase HipA
LAGKTAQNDGTDYKYNYSYEAIGSLIQQYVAAWPVDIEKYFRLIVFNYLFSNGDAHLKNFALLENPSGDYGLSPAYDLINTRIHVEDTDFALSKGLFEDDFQSDYYKRNNHVCSTDFKEFAKRIGIKVSRIDLLLNFFLEKYSKIETLIAHSFLDDKSKKTYWQMYLTKLNHLKSQ